ncbi:protein-S-isoprenylcysteine O-methyltransferase [Neoroseomonas lacus]|uniref:Farnesyl cysteine carboxyl-methyltransferase n=1 Tax=Neoroseomonas lacus TaxID=287609 RepID=A0A917L143_9PROT|nr:protein-S-isoprenylcysteine O-methyltransferase [Neoroseomonas lacus]GGJ36923.1 farnesyl cysteine carboxyl-methyltransferase [Neoroseomonas lacus]
MTPLVAKLLYGLCMIAWWVIRRPFERKSKRNVLLRDAMDVREKTLLLISLTGLGVIPLAYIATGFPKALDQGFSPLRAVAGLLVFVASLVLFYATHKALGRNWSVTLAVRAEHSLVTGGVYRFVRHPMYTAFWMWAIAQALTLQNWVAGPAGIIGFGLLYLLRVGREEALMRETFGTAWDDYAARTPRVIPFLS